MEALPKKVVLEDVKSILSLASDYVSQGWVQCEFATDAKGNEVDPLSDDACKFCMTGAIDRAVWDLDLTLHTEEYWDELDRVIHKVLPSDDPFGHGVMVHFNDDEETTQQDVITAFDRARDIVGKF